MSVTATNYNAVADTWLQQLQPDKNWGTNDDVYVNSNNHHVLVKFDVSDIPVTATCTSVKLKMTSYNTRTSTSDCSVYSLTSGASTWVENEATWNNMSSGTPWPGSGGASTSGTDYEPTLLGTITCPLTHGTQVEASLDATRIQKWWSESKNYGLVLIGTSANNATWYSRESSFIPQLELSISLPSQTLSPVPATIVTQTVNPLVIRASTPPVPIRYSGDVFLTTYSGSLSTCLLSTGGSNWVITDGSGDPVDSAVRIVRREAYLIPR